MNLKKKAATLHKFLDKVKYLIGIYYLKANAKQRLLLIIIQYSEMVSQYYQQIFGLWKHIGMLADEYIEKFICTLQLLIAAPLLGYYYINIKDLLDKAR